MQPLLSIRQLSITFTQYRRGLGRTALPALRGLELSLYRGEVCAVVGASGSGKSLLAHSLLGLLPHNAAMTGEILFQGQPLTQQRAQALRGREISLIPQGVSYLDPMMTVGAQLRRGRRGQGEERRVRDALGRRGQGEERRVRDALGRYGLPEDTAGRYPFQLSGGMARRVLIAAGTQEKPALLIADEPTPGLDEPAALQVLRRFRALAEEGAGVLLITHDLELALTAAHRLVILYAGQGLESAAANDFLREETLCHPYTRALWRAMPQHGFQPLPGSQPAPGAAPSGCPFAPRCSRRTPECLADPIPLRETPGGWVRCRHPFSREEPS